MDCVQIPLQALHHLLDLREQRLAASGEQTAKSESGKGEGEKKIKKEG
jgi:hypothetical protein